MSNETKKDGPQFSMEQVAEMMTKAMAEGVAKGLAMQEIQRQDAEAAKQNAQNRKFSQANQICSRCHQKVVACGGPEMVEQYDRKGNKILDKDGKPVMGEKMDFKTGKPVADKNHLFVVILPQDPDAAKAFQGSTINGVQYRSNNRRHKIFVPREGAAALLIANHFERYDKEMRRGHTNLKESTGLSRQEIKQSVQTGW